LPAYLALVAAGFSLYQLNVGRVELAIAARVGAAHPDATTAVHQYLKENRVVSPDRVHVTVQRTANLRRVTVRCEVRPLEGLGLREPGYQLSASAALGEAVLCVR
jgi:hypothetical protein